MGIDSLYGVLFSIGMAGAAYLIWKVFDLLGRLHVLEGEATILRAGRKHLVNRIHNLEDEIWKPQNPPFNEDDVTAKGE